MSDQLKRMLKEIGLAIGLLVLQRYQKYIDKDEVEAKPRRRSTDVKLASERDFGSNAETDHGPPL